MASVLPTVKSGASCLYPLKRSNTQDVAVTQAYNGSEQRFKRRGGLAGFTLQYSNLALADKQSIDTFFSSTKGSFDSTWTFPLFASQQPYPVNGSFQNGLTGWTFGNTTALTSGTNGGSFARNGIPSAVFYSNGAAIGANQQAVGSFNATPIPCQPGQTWTLSFWYWLVQNGSAPIGVVPSVQVYVSFYDSASNLLAEIQAASGSTGGGFQSVLATFQVTYQNAASFYLFFQPILTNTTGAPITVPTSSNLIALNSISANLTGPAIAAQPPNGNFANGLTSWGTFVDPGLTAGTNGGTFARNGFTSAVAYSSGSAIAANHTASATFTSALVPCNSTQSWALSFWYFLAANNSVPSGVNLGFSVYISLYDQTNVLIQEFSPVGSQTALNAWTQCNCSFNITAQGAKNLVLLVVFTLQNSNGSPVTVPLSSALGALNSVTLFPNTASETGGIYPSCAFEQDELVWTQNRQNPTLWNTTVKVRQTVSGGSSVTASSYPGAFPMVRSGIVSGFPYSPSSRFETDRNDLPSGPRISFAWYGSGLTNFPTRALNGWGLSFSSVSDADLAAIESHFVACGGKYLHFTFTDPDTGTAYPNVRYDMDSLDITHRQYGQNDFKVTLAEYWA